MLHVEDEHDDVMVTVAEDGSISEHRIGGLAGLREALGAASPYSKVLVPDDAGRKKWTRLDPEPAPELKPEPEAAPTPEPAAAAPAPAVPAVSGAVAGTARTLAVQVHQRRVKPKADYFTHGIPTADAEAWIAYAVGQGWVVEDGDLLRPGKVNPEPMTALPDERSSRGWTRIFG